jgi:hypothetical protein
MHMKSLIDHVIEIDFPEFCNGATTNQISYFTGGPDCLMDFIQVWVMLGRGVRESNADFATYMVLVAAIIAEWHRDPGITDYSPSRPEGEPEVYESRRMDSVLRPGERWHEAIMPHWFARQALEHQFPHLRHTDNAFELKFGLGIGDR